MNASALLDISTATILVNNIVLSRSIGVCPLCGAAGKPKNAIGMGLSATVLMTVSSALAWLINDTFLVPLGAQYLQILVFVMVIVSLTLTADLVLRGLAPSPYKSAGKYLPALASNCAVVAAAMLAVRPEPVTMRGMSLPTAIFYGFSTGTGFMLALLLFSAIRQKLELSNVPKPLQGLPAIFLGIGLLSLAFMGFSDFHFFRGYGR
jgi:Na+-translocating ferredoxin:NAD+ oxidoreductase subunit A